MCIEDMFLLVRTLKHHINRIFSLITSHTVGGYLPKYACEYTRIEKYGIHNHLIGK